MGNFNWWKTAVIAVAAVALFGLGFYLGRAREPEVITKTITKYIKLPPVRDSIPYPVPYIVVEPVDSADVIRDCVASGKFADLFPTAAAGDTVYITKKDTAAVLLDWASERRYAETLFDSDTLGRCDINATIKYNRLEGLGYVFTPIQKQSETVIKTRRKFLPYLGGGISTDGAFMAQGGMFFNQDAGFGLEYRYDKDTGKKSLGIAALYMF